MKRMIKYPNKYFKDKELKVNAQHFIITCKAYDDELFRTATINLLIILARIDDEGCVGLEDIF